MNITETVENDDRWEWERIARDLGVSFTDTLSTAQLRLNVLDAARVSLLPTRCDICHEPTVGENGHTLSCPTRWYRAVA